MKLDILQTQIGLFSALLHSREGALHSYKYRLLDHFHTTWTFDTDDFAGMYDRALQSDVTRRWWKRDHYRPKEMMLVLIRHEEQYVRQAFRELFNENKNIENRLDRFNFYCDELLRMYKRANPKSIENNHYQDSMIISLYLAGLYPEKYTIYPGREIFNQALRVLHAKESTDKDDLPRFFKLSHTIHQYLLKDKSMLEIMEKGMRPAQHLLPVHEFFYFLAGRWDENVPA